MVLPRLRIRRDRSGLLGRKYGPPRKVETPLYPGAPDKAGEEGIPWRTISVSLLGGILNIAWFIFAWGYGVQWQGLTHTIVVALINVGFYSGMMAITIKSRKAPSYWLNFWYHWIFFLWFSWYSFPWLGETP